MIRLSKVLAIIISSALLFSFSGCQLSSSNGELDASPPRVALIMQGPISDMAWNASAYKGLTKIEKIGAEVEYQENVGLNSVGDIIKAYGEDGVNIVFLATNGYEETVCQIAPSYPKTQFVIMNGEQTKGNVFSTQIADEEQGYMMGVISAIATRSNKVGFVGGSDILPIVNGQKGFEQGVKYVDDSIEIFADTLDNFKNINQAKDISVEFIKNGVDVICPICDQSAIGVIDAAEEYQIMSVCSGSEQENAAIKSGLIAVEKDTSIAYDSTFKKILANELGNTIQKIGAKDGAIYLSNWFSASSILSEEDKAFVEETFEKLKSGEIIINLD